MPGFLCKPHPNIYKIVENILDATEETYFFNDCAEDVESAKKHVWKVYLVTNEFNVKVLS